MDVTQFVDRVRVESPWLAVVVASHGDRWVVAAGQPRCPACDALVDLAAVRVSDDDAAEPVDCECGSPAPVAVVVVDELDDAALVDVRDAVDREAAVTMPTPGRRALVRHRRCGQLARAVWVDGAWSVRCTCREVTRLGVDVVRWGGRGGDVDDDAAGSHDDWLD